MTDRETIVAMLERIGKDFRVTDILPPEQCVWVESDTAVTEFWFDLDGKLLRINSFGME